MTKGRVRPGLPPALGRFHPAACLVLRICRDRPLAADYLLGRLEETGQELIERAGERQADEPAHDR